MVKKVMKSNEKRAVKAENAERRHRNLILAAVALTAAVAIVSLVLFIRTASQLKRGTNEEERTDIPVLIGNINSDGGAEQLYGVNCLTVRSEFPKHMNSQCPTPHMCGRRKLTSDTLRKIKSLNLPGIFWRKPVNTAFSGKSEDDKNILHPSLRLMR